MGADKKTKTGMKGKIKPAAAGTGERKLMEEAIRAREAAYAPYSHFKVGAALLSSSGKIYTGCNIENAALTPGNCAERTAFFKAVSEGERSFQMIAIFGGPEEAETFGYCAPCGVCRQVMEEFCSEDKFTIVLGKSAGKRIRYRLKELLPAGFGPENLKGEK